MSKVLQLVGYRGAVDGGLSEIGRKVVTLDMAELTHNMWGTEAAGRCYMYVLCVFITVGFSRIKFLFWPRGSRSQNSV